MICINGIHGASTIIDDLHQWRIALSTIGRRKPSIAMRNLAASTIGRRTIIDSHAKHRCIGDRPSKTIDGRAKPQLFSVQFVRLQVARTARKTKEGKYLAAAG